jgi:hypothetical protein
VCGAAIYSGAGLLHSSCSVPGIQFILEDESRRDSADTTGNSYTATQDASATTEGNQDAVLEFNSAKWSQIRKKQRGTFKEPAARSQGYSLESIKLQCNDHKESHPSSRSIPLGKQRDTKNVRTIGTQDDLFTCLLSRALRAAHSHLDRDRGRLDTLHRHLLFRLVRVSYRGIFDRSHA